MAEIKETKIYHYHPVTKEFMGESVARLDPLEGKPLIPAHATIVEIPSDEVGQNETYVFDGREWVVQPDYRGQVFYKENGETLEIKALGQKMEKGWSTEKPEPQPLSDDEILSGIKSEAARRIADSGHDWMALRQVTTGRAVPKKIIKYANKVREASDAMKETLPQNFADDKHWPAKI